MMKSATFLILFAIASFGFAPIDAEARTCADCIGTVYVSGTVLPGSSGSYCNLFCGAGFDVDFTGQKASAEFEIMRYPGDIYYPPSIYISSFSASWSNQKFSDPLIQEYLVEGISMSGGGPNNDDDDLPYDTFSDIQLNKSNLSVSVFNTMYYEIDQDGFFDLGGGLGFSGLHDYNTSFSTPASGTFNFYYYVDRFGPYSYSSGTFEATSFTFMAAPDAPSWALVLLGAAGVGTAIRRRRRSSSAVLGL